MLEKLINLYLNRVCMRFLEANQEYFDASDKEVEKIYKNIAKLEIDRQKHRERLKNLRDNGVWIYTEEEKIENQKRKEKFDVAVGLTDKDFNRMVKEEREFYPHLTDEEILDGINKVATK